MKSWWLAVPLALLVVMDRAESQWVQTSGPTGGNIQSFAVMGSSLYAGAGGSVWVSSNNGANWSRVSSGLTIGAGSVSSLAVVGTSLYAATTSGVFSSTNNGLSWDTASTGLADRDVRALAVIGTTLFAGTSLKGVFCSSNGGLSWDSVNTGLQYQYVNALTVSGTTLFAGTSIGGVYRSTDNGQSWDSASTGLTFRYVNSFGVLGGNLFAGTAGGGIFRSTNNGASWVAVNTGLQSYVVDAFAVSGTYLFAGTGGGVHRSTDNGSSWSAMTAGIPTLFVEALAVMGSNLFAGTGGGGVYLSGDNGSSWSAVNTGLTNAYIWAYALSGTNLFAGTNGDLFLSADEGTTWNPINRTLTEQGFAAVAINGVDLFAGTFGGGIVHSTNNGSTWTHANSGLSGPGSSYVIALAVSGTSMYAGTNGGAFVSTNNGTSWTDISPGLPSGGVSNFAFSGTNVFAGTGRGVYRSTNNGTTWSAVNNGIPNGDYNSAKALLVIGGSLFVGTYDGVYTSTDNGANWNPSNTGLSGQWVNALALVGTNLYAGANGVYRSTNNGATWDSVKTGLPVASVTALASSSTNLFAGVTNYSTWRRSLSDFAVPAAPAATAATSVTTSGFTADWSASSGGTGYRLDVATDIAFTQILAGYNNLPVAGTNQIVTGLNSGTSYYYRVRAVSAGGASTNSNVVTVSTLPNSPNASAATAVKTNGFTANWSAPTGATGYHLDVATDSAFVSTVAGYNNVDVGNVTSYPVTGLNPGTTYFYRVRAAGGGGTGANSNVITVSTLPNSPVAYTATGITTTGFTASWSAPGGATGYRLYVATDSAFVSTVAGYNNLNVGNVTSYPVTGLNPGVSYYYQVRAVNAGGASANSNVITAATLPANPNTPTATSATSISTTGFTANWNTVSGATGYRLDVATDSGFLNFVPPYNSIDAGSATSYGVTGLQEGTAYYYRVRAVSGALTSGNSNTIMVTTNVTYPSTYALSWDVNFPSKATLKDYDPTDYQLVGLPGNSGRLISQFLTGSQEAQWEVFWDNGTQQAYPGYYEKFNGGADFQCSTGKAFWVLQIGEWKKSGDSVTTSSLNANREAVIPLPAGKGYYLITNPFTRTISWATVTSHNGLTGSPIRAWTSSGWVNATDFAPYQGYLYFNDSGATALRVPYDLTVPKTTATPPADVTDWRVDVRARCGHVVDQTSSFGISRTAGTGMDPLEERKPRHFAIIPDVYFERPSWDATFSEFATDIRPEVSELEAWEMTLRSDERKPVDLEFLGVEKVPPEYDVYLLDGAGGRALDLRKEPKYTLKPATSITPLSVVVGKPDRVKAKVDEIMPKDYALEQNYPNPFNPTTTIPVTVPQECRVILEIYNILGQRVRTLYNGMLAQGRYTFDWDGKGDRMQQNATGVYICILRAGDAIRLTRKMALLK